MAPFLELEGVAPHRWDPEQELCWGELPLGPWKVNERYHACQGRLVTRAGREERVVNAN